MSKSIDLSEGDRCKGGLCTKKSLFEILEREMIYLFIKTTDNHLVNLDAIATIYIDGFAVIANARDLRGDGIHKPHTHIYTLGMYHNIIQAIHALNELEKSIAAQSPLHIMQDPNPDPDAD